MFSTTSPCKLNLFLYITGKRLDGYHNLQTLFTILNYGDKMHFNLRDDGEIKLLTDFGFPQSENLIYKAALALKNEAKKNLGCEISVNKVLAQGGGLGGGSSNAATTLLVLNKLWHLDLTEEKLLQIARSLGADVPIFVKGRPCFAQGIGDILEPIKIKPRFYIVCNPKVQVPTKLMFNSELLKKDSPKLSYEELLKKPFENCFTAPALALFPQIGDLLALLAQYGKSYMSGSGASCFISFDTEKEAIDVFEKLKAQGISCFLAQDCEISPVLLDLKRI